MQSLKQDIRYALRTWRNSPLSTVAAVLTLALGIGAATAIFSIVNGLLLRPLPVRDPQRVVQLYSTDLQGKRGSLNMQDVLDWKRHLHSFEALAFYRPAPLNLTGGGEPRFLAALLCDADIFRVLGINVIRGRNFLSEENRPGQDESVILSYGFWQSQFGGREVVGHTFRLDGQPRFIAGVLPQHLDIVDRRIDIWVPLAFDRANPLNARGIHAYTVFGLLKPTVSVAEANAELARETADLAAAFPVQNKGVGAIAVPLRESVSGKLKTPLTLLFASVMCVLFISCANVANLLLSKSSQRLRETSVRLAVGAGRWRLFQQVMTESVLLAAVSSFAGAALAVAAVHYVKHLPTTVLARTGNIVLDLRLLAFSVAVVIATALLFGLLPALRASHVDINEALKQAGGRVTESKRQQRVRRVFIGLETALATLLLIESILLIRSFEKATHVDAHFATDHLLTMYLSLPAQRYGEDSVVFGRLANQIIAKMRALPGIQNAAFTSDIPFYSAFSAGPVTIEGRPAPKNTFESPFVVLTAVTSTYCQTLKLPILQGRDFNRADDADGAPAVLVNQAFVRQFFQGQNPLGQKLAFSSRPDWHIIVGVMADSIQRDIDKPTRPQIFMPLYRSVEAWPALVARTAGNPGSYLKPLQDEIQQADPEIPIFLPRTVDQIIDDQLGPRALQTYVLSFFAAAALLLSAVGIYAVVAYSISQRTAEIGLRMAFGASQNDVVRLIVRQGITPALIGAAAGAITAFAVAKLFSQLLFDISFSNPPAYLLGFLLLTAVAAAACYFPARRASTIDPLAALRYE